MKDARKPLILNVNDHVANRYMVSKMLKNAGMQVIEASTGGEAMALAQDPQQKPDLIVLDIRLPDIDGLTVCRRLKADPRTRDIKILHTSATFVTSTNRVEGVEAGADGYLTQPFEPQDLIATVRALLRLHDAEAALVARNGLLVEADRRKDEFLAMLAHELRNPLAALHMGLPVLDRYPPRDELEQQTRDIMGRQLTLLTRLVDDLLDVSRVTRGRIVLHREPMDLAALVRRVVEVMRQRAAGPRRQELRLVLPPQPVPVLADGGRIEQVLTNLLDNASKYSDAGTTIEIRLALVGGQAEVVVRDQGIGIDAATLPAIFDLFAQATRSLDRSHGGLGIGLTLARGLIDLHGGTITARSDGLGLGTELTIRLPLQAARELAPAQPSEPAAAPARRRILVVDDNEDGRKMLRKLCELQGHDVAEAADGLEGVRCALEGRPDVAFVDIGLPGIDGYEVARRVRAGLDGHSPVLIALSGYGSPEHRELAHEAGFDEHVVKPIKLANLRRIVGAAAPKA
ncbi:response regulator [Nannocystis bainbridge]|uniref:histidine kinase n=1 Tax=Nannocystis bainbridge TaxID=2995303 RepID=A0ABT5DPK6_9BACT|nr:response regulator [Nannocystis bainbridge]MDC0715586.1 response regulator [Nannocystis bainbridge]